MFAGIFHRDNWGRIAHIFVRFCQMILAIAVIGLYAQDLNRAHKEKKYSDGKWVYATVVSSLSAVTALVYIIILLLAHSSTVALLFAWDLILFVLWAALFGIFGKMYINERVEMDGGVRRMKDAVWVDLVNMLMWFGTAVWGVWYFFLGGGGGRNRFSKKAKK